MAAIAIFVPKVLSALYLYLKERYLKFPQNREDWIKIALEFEDRWQFPNYLGALDGKQIHIYNRSEKTALTGTIIRARTA